VTSSALESEQAHLSDLLEAVQRCVYFLDASDRKHSWPLTAKYLSGRRKDIALFESLAAINERFAKLQDTLGAAMRHAAILAGERVETFLKVLSFYEKVGVLNSVSAWQLCRTTRNLAAHDTAVDLAGEAGLVGGSAREHLVGLHARVGDDDRLPRPGVAGGPGVGRARNCCRGQGIEMAGGPRRIYAVVVTTHPPARSVQPESCSSGNREMSAKSA
jgi:hypothetical protein